MDKKIILKGLAVSTGIAQGTVKIVAGVKDSHKFNEGDILVTKITDPSMVMLMSKSAAIICDIGGMTSHPSIVSREMGIPCVVNAKEATTRLKDGMQVMVDGSKGEVYEILDNSVKEYFNKKHFDIDKYLDTVTDACLLMDYATFDDTIAWFSYDPLIAKSWTQRILKMIDDCQSPITSTTLSADKLGTELNFKEIGLLFPSISQLRVMMIFDLWMANYAGISQAEYENIFTFYTKVLEATCLEDPHAAEFKNVIHTKEQTDELLSRLQPANEEIAKILGKISNICYHFGHAAYADMNPATCYENYGPYDVSDKYGPGHVLIIKEFNNLQCPDLWPATKKNLLNRIHVVAVYKDVEVEIDNASHVNYKGDLIKNLKYYRLLVDGLDYPIEDYEIINLIGEQAIKIFQEFQALDFEDRKAKFYHQKAHVYKKIYDKLGQDWRPSQEILNEAKGKSLFDPQWPKDRDKQWQLTRDIVDPRKIVK
ncbi:hypothetical protein K8R42_00220 [bacterium]|nr:hypothetical protein [bacterium]